MEQIPIFAFVKPDGKMIFVTSVFLIGNAQIQMKVLHVKNQMNVYVQGDLRILKIYAKQLCKKLTMKKENYPILQGI